MEWLIGLISKVDAITEQKMKEQEPHGAVAADEITLGVLPSDLRRFHALLGEMIDDFNQSVTEHLASHERPDHIPEMCLEFHAMVAEAAKELELTREIFWREVRAEFETSERIGLRAGWVVVRMPPKANNEDGWNMLRTALLLDIMK
jgi:hypothetical protein